MDAVQQANSGHPGAPMGAGLMAYVLWDRVLKHNPADPRWPDRDRFVLSAGHASMLLYSLLYLTGYGITLDDIKTFRQWMSPHAGHPERGLLPGIETTTGPLGQGFANAVGHGAGGALPRGDVQPAGPRHRRSLHVRARERRRHAGRRLARGGVFAGHQGLGKLIVLYDDNQVQLDGPTDLAFSEDVGKRFEAYGWHVQRIDGMDHDAVESRWSRRRPTGGPR